MDLLDLAKDALKEKNSRVNLDVNKNYTKVKIVNNTVIKEYVGKFVKTYCMGSGDGMTVHMEFNDNGRVTRVNEEMWGSVTGYELSYFIEA